MSGAFKFLEYQKSKTKSFFWELCRIKSLLDEHLQKEETVESKILENEDSGIAYCEN